MSKSIELTNPFASFTYVIGSLTFLLSLVMGHIMPVLLIPNPYIKTKKIQKLMHF